MKILMKEIYNKKNKIGASTHSIYGGFFMMLNKDPTITTTNQSHTQKTTNNEIDEKNL